MSKMFIHHRSIRATMAGILLFIIAIMVISFIIILHRQNVVSREYDHFAQNYFNLSRLPGILEKSSTHFELYLRERNDESLAHYEEAYRQMKSIIALIQDEPGVDDDLTFYSRSLTNMMDYHRDLAGETLKYPNFTEIIYLRDLYDYMTQQSHSLTASYLNYGSLRYSEILEKEKQVTNTTYILLAVITMMSIGFAALLTRGLFQTIKTLARFAKLLAIDAQWHIPDLKPSKYIELNVVADAFNLMKRNMRQYINDLQEKASIELELSKEKLKNLEIDRLLKETQLRSLQMQMNPHFLFNTLNMISRKAMLRQADSAVELIQSISEILRYNLDNEGRPVELREEIRVLKSYLTIQQMRFQGRMTIDLRQTLKEGLAFIPPMTLQPIVENAIIHGLQNSVQGGRIVIEVAEEGSHFEIRIEDNGKGMTEEQLEQLFQRQGESGKNSIGLDNVRRRLEIQFNRSDLMTVVSRPGQGTTVAIIIPKEGEQGDVNLAYSGG